MKKIWRSRLAKKQETKNLRKAALYLFLSFILVITLIFFGLPLLIKTAVFLGNLKSISSPIEKKDTTPPPPPQIFTLYEATKSAEINLQGFAEPGSTVELFLNDSSQNKIIVENDGSFFISNLKLVEGRNELYALNIDSAGNISQSSNRLTVIYDRTPPELIINQPENNARFWEDNNKIEIIGESEEEATIMVNDRLATMTSGKKFNFPFTLIQGENKIKIVALDKAGNQTEKELTLFLK